jgi:hypothetical protein
MPPPQGADVVMPQHISEKLKEFKETIHYTNPVGGALTLEPDL